MAGGDRYFALTGPRNTTQDVFKNIALIRHPIEIPKTNDGMVLGDLTRRKENSEIRLKNDPASSDST
jgi:hypothetical protein